MSTRKDKTAVPLIYRALSLGPETINSEERSVDATLATEQAVEMFDYERGEMVPEILLMDGCTIPKTKQVPLLDSHQRYSTEDVIGSIRGLKIRGGELIGRVHFSSTAEEPYTKMSEGHLTDLSVGYRVIERTYVPRGQKQKIGNRFFTGPMNVATRWTVKEGSVAPIGADDRAKFREDQTDIAAVSLGEGTSGKGPDLEEEKREELAMDKETRELLIKRGMPADLSDADALKWLNEHRAELFGPPAPPPPPPPGQDDLRKLVADTVSAAVTTAVPQVLSMERERQEKARKEADALCELAGIRADDKVYAIALNEGQDKLRAYILERRKANQTDVGAGRLDSGYTRDEKAGAMISTALLYRCMQNLPSASDGVKMFPQLGSVRQSEAPTPEKRLEQVFEVESQYRSNGTPCETWAERKDRAKGWEQYRYYSLLDLAREVLEINGIRNRGMTTTDIARFALFPHEYYREQRRSFVSDLNFDVSRNEPAYHVTASFPDLTLDAMNKSMLAAYVERPFTWEGPMRRGESVKDFKKFYRIRLGEYPNFDITPDNKAPNQASLDDEKESSAVEARSSEISFSWQLIVNDDMNTLARIPGLMGNAANRTVNTVAWSVVTANPTLVDGQALFSAATGNRKKANLVTSGSGAPTRLRLNEARRLMRLQVGVNTPEGAASQAILNIEPRYLIVPANLEGDGETITRNEYDQTDNKFQGYNPYGPRGRNRLELVVEPLLDDNSTAKWYVFASPSQVDTIEVVFLQGQETPYTRNYMDDKTLAMFWQIWQTYTAFPVDHRGVFRDDGAA